MTVSCQSTLPNAAPWEGWASYEDTASQLQSRDSANCTSGASGSWCLAGFCLLEGPRGRPEAARGRWNRPLSALLPAPVHPPPPAMQLHPCSGRSSQWRQLWQWALFLISRTSPIVEPQRLRRVSVPSSQVLSAPWFLLQASRFWQSNFFL